MGYWDLMVVIKWNSKRISKTIYSFTTSSGQRENIIFLYQENSGHIGYCAFSVAGQRLWNLLPQDIKQPGYLAIFITKLKTFLCNQYYH